ncbi:MAG: DNA polymerase III subunit gamma/tau [Opitutales bacterium]|nr:DNA polymerase III subunit gamma/tau [Opitutales bacterium]
MVSETAFLEALPEPLRKTRPVAVLARSLERGRLAHAILLQSENPAAQEEVALALACALLECDAEKAARHPDLFTLRPAGKARIIRVGDDASTPNSMRALLHGIQQTPRVARRKVAVVYEADRMNAQTANAFLKTLEEPPADTTLLLLTARPHDLLPTIHSRCFHFRLTTEAQLAPDASWDAWIADYRTWLERATAPEKDAAARAQLLLGAYGLIVRFQAVVTAQADAAWKSARESLAADLDDDELAASETGFRKGLRNHRLADIAKATAAFAREFGKERPYPVSSLHHALERLDHLTRLLETNLKDDAALEIFFLSSLRAWARAA